MADESNAGAGNTESQADASASTEVGTTVLTDEGAGKEGGQTAQQGNAETGAADTSQAGDGSKADGEGGEQDGEKKAGAPDKYEFKLADGRELDAEAVAAFEPMARELNLTNEQAQKFVDLYAAQQQKQAEAWAAQTAEWVNAVKADKEIGGDAMPASVRHAQAAIKAFGTPELKAALDQTGLGNHPELVRTFARIGKAMAEDGFVSGNGSGSGGEQARLARLYPSMTPAN